MKDRIKPEAKELCANLIASIFSNTSWRGTLSPQQAIEQAGEHATMIMDLVGVDWEIKKRGPKPKTEEAEQTETPAE
jgi:ornithine carbamoyltransferase